MGVVLFKHVRFVTSFSTPDAQFVNPQNELELKNEAALAVIGVRNVPVGIALKLYILLPSDEAPGIEYVK